MRSISRMQPTLTAVAELWALPEYQDFRLGQLLWHIAGRDPFFIEDEEVQKVCKEIVTK